MKLLYVTNTRFPSERAHSIQIAHMCQAFAELGCETTLVSNNRSTDGVSAIKSYFGFDPSFTIIKISFGLIFIMNSKFFFLINNTLYLVNLLVSVNLSKFDVIYTREEWLCYLLTFIVSNNKLVFESHEAKFNFPARQLLKKRIKVVTISQGIFDCYKEKGVSQDQMIVADDSIDESFFESDKSVKQIRENLNIPVDTRVAMYIGGFDEWKGVDVFFASSEICKDVDFVAVGGSDVEISKLKKLWPRVFFVGPRPYRELKDNQRAADILIIPNTAKNELSAKLTSPLKLFAHMASGIPLILSDIPSLSRIVPSNEAYFFTPDTPQSLAEVIKKVLSDPESKIKAFKLMERAKGYTWSARARKVLSFIKRRD